MRKLFLFTLLLMAGASDAWSQDSVFHGSIETAIGVDFSKRIPPHGSRYLFESAWVKGDLISSDNRYVQNDSLLYNYDKLSQDIYLTADKNNAVRVDKREIKSITLYYFKTPYTFEHLYEINKNDLFLVLIKDPGKYCLYKFITSRQRESEFVDTYSYFIIFPNKQFVRIFKLSHKSIWRAFAFGLDRQRVNDFSSLHLDEAANEDYLKRLIKYLNE